MDKIKSIIKKLTRKKSSKPGKGSDKKLIANTVIPREHHVVSRKAISNNALKVLYKLSKEGFNAYLVGGGVRDLLLGREPKDFDVVTNANPDQIRQLFNNCRLIGRRFRLAHVYFKNEIIEVATFRATSDSSLDNRFHNTEGMIIRDNVYGTIEEDVWRRDFTVNALYYNIANFSIVDYVNGMADLKAGVIRIIGDPNQRFREDPVRILRAIRFAAKLGFKIHPDTEIVLTQLAQLLTYVSKARLFDEVTKLFFQGYACQTFALLRHYQMFSLLFPLTEASLCDPQYHQMTDILVLATLKNTDLRFQQDKPLTLAFLLAAFLWFPMLQSAETYKKEGFAQHIAFENAMNDVISAQQQCFNLPKHSSQMIIEIWSLQTKLLSAKGKNAIHFLHHRRFRAAYDFLLLRTQIEPELKKVAKMWTTLQQQHGVDKG